MDSKARLLFNFLLAGGKRGIHHAPGPIVESVVREHWAAQNGHSVANLTVIESGFISVSAAAGLSRARDAITPGGD